MTRQSPPPLYFSITVPPSLSNLISAPANLTSHSLSQLSLVLSSASAPQNSRLAATAAYFLSGPFSHLSTATSSTVSGSQPYKSEQPLSHLPVLVLSSLPAHFHSYIPQQVTSACALAAPRAAHFALVAGKSLKAAPLVPKVVSGAAEAACLFIAQSLDVMASSVPSTATRDRGAAMLDGGQSSSCRSTGSAKADELRHQVFFLEHQCRLLYGIGPGGELHPFAAPSELVKLAKSVNESVSMVTHLFLWADRNDPIAVDTFLELNAFNTLLHPLGPPPPSALVSTSAWPALAHLPIHVAHSLSQCVLDAISAIFTNVTGPPTLYYLLSHFANKALEADYGLYPPPVPPISSNSSALVPKTPPRPIPTGPSNTATHRSSWSQSASPVLVPLLSLTSAGARSLAEAVASAPALVAGRFTPPRSPLTSVMSSLPWPSGFGAGHSGTHSTASSPGRTPSHDRHQGTPSRSASNYGAARQPTRPASYSHTRSSSISLTSSSSSSMSALAAEDIDRAELAAHFAALVRAIANRGVSDPDTLHTLFSPSNSKSSVPTDRPRSAFPLLTRSLAALAICTDPMSRAALTSVIIAIARTACSIPMLAHWMVENATRQIADVAISALTSGGSRSGSSSRIDHGADDDNEWVWPWLDDVIGEAPPDFAACLSGHLLVRYVLPMVVGMREWDQLTNEILAEVRAVPLVSVLVQVVLGTGGVGRLAEVLDGPYAWYDEQLAAFDRTGLRAGVLNADGPVCELNVHRVKLLADVAGASGVDEQLGAMRALLAMLRHPSVPPHVWSGRSVAGATSISSTSDSVSGGHVVGSTTTTTPAAVKGGVGWGPAPGMRRMWLVAQATGVAVADEAPGMDPSALLVLLARALAKSDNAHVWATGVSIVFELACVRVPGSNGWWEPIGVPSVPEIAELAASQVEGLVAAIGGHRHGGLVGSVPLVPHAQASRHVSQALRSRNGSNSQTVCLPGDMLAGWLAIWHVAVRPLAAPPSPLFPRVHAIASSSTPPPPPVPRAPSSDSPPPTSQGGKGDSSIRRHRSALSFSAARGMAPGAIMIASGGSSHGSEHQHHPLSHSLPNAPPPMPMLVTTATSPTRTTATAAITVTAVPPSAMHSRTSTTKSASSSSHRRTGSWAGPVPPTLPPGTPVKSPYLAAPGNTLASGSGLGGAQRAGGGGQGKGGGDLKAGVRDCLAQARELGISSMAIASGFGKSVGLAGVDEQ